MKTSECQAERRVPSSISCVAAVSATGSVLCNEDLLPRICAFQYGFLLLVRPLAEPPWGPLPPHAYPRVEDPDDENQPEPRKGVFPARATKVDDLTLLSALQRVVERHREYERYEELSFCGVIHAAIEAGAMHVLEWAHQQDDAFWPTYSGWADQCFKLFPRRVSSQVLAWLDTHRPEVYRHQGRYAIQAAIRRGHVDVLRYCYMHAPDAFEPRGGLRISGGSLPVVRFLLEETSLAQAQSNRFLEWVSRDAMHARHFYLVDYLRHYLRERGDEDKYTLMMDVLLTNAARYEWTDVIEYMKAIGEWTDDRAQRATLRSSALPPIKSEELETVDIPLTVDPDALRSALVDACRNGRYRMVEALLTHGAVQPDLSCICEAAQYGHVEVVSLLFQEARATAAFGDHHWAWLVQSLVSTPPTAESVKSGKFYAAVKLIVDAVTASRDEAGCWQLVDAVLSNRGMFNYIRVTAAVLGFLLRRLRGPAAPAVRSSVSAMMPDTLEGETVAEGEVALRFAITMGRFDVIRFQHQMGAKGFTSSLVVEAAAEGQLEILRLLCETRGLKISTDALVKAQANGHTSVVEFLQSHAP